MPPPWRSKVSTSASRCRGRKTSSASQNAISSPRASAMPRLRAAATPAFSCETTRTGSGNAPAISAVASREPSSTTTTSRSA